jgi:hypothetical protein
MPPVILRNTPGQSHYLDTVAGPWIYGGVTTNTTALPAISAKVDSLTVPATVQASGIFVIERPTGSLVQFRFWGTDAANETAKYRIWRWSQLVEKNDRGLTQYHAELVAAGIITLGAQVGIAGGILTASHFYADQITDTSGRSAAGNVTNAIICVSSTPDDNSANIRVDPEGDMVLEVQMSMQGEVSPMASVGFNYRGLTIG